MIFKNSFWTFCPFPTEISNTLDDRIARIWILLDGSIPNFFKLSFQYYAIYFVL